MRHQYELLRSLELPGIVKALGLANTNEGLALLMTDAGETTLAEKVRCGPFAMADFLDCISFGMRQLAVPR